MQVVISGDDARAQLRTELEQIAKRVGAVAAVRIVELGRTAEVWIADRATRKTVIREFVRTSEPDESEDALAVGVVELLRASLMELSVPETAEQRPVLPEQAELKRIAFPLPTKPQAHALLAMTLAPAIELGLGSLGASLHGRFAFAFRPHDGFGARATATTTLSSPTLRDARGDAEFSSHAFGLQGTYAWSIFNGQVVPSLALGMAYVSLNARGVKASKVTDTRDESAGVLASQFSASATLRLGGNLALNADVSALYAIEPIEIRFVSSEVATWGRPAILIALGIEADFMLDE